jgi:hypothetical protein
MAIELHNYLRYDADGIMRWRKELRDLTGLVLTKADDLPAEELRGSGRTREQLQDEGMGEVAVENRKDIPPDQRRPSFQLYSVRPLTRVGPDGQVLNQLLFSITQRRTITVSDSTDAGEEQDTGQNEKKTWTFRGGCTFIVDLSERKLRYCISKSMNDVDRFLSAKAYREDRLSRSLLAAYFGTPYGEGSSKQGLSRFALMHSKFTHEEDL